MPPEELLTPPVVSTEGITRQDVDEALEYLQMHNPKPEIPIEQTVTGHELVAVARRFAALKQAMIAQGVRIARLEQSQIRGA
jgi:hypothetical protein